MSTQKPGDQGTTHVRSLNAPWKNNADPHVHSNYKWIIHTAIIGTSITIPLVAFIVLFALTGDNEGLELFKSFSGEKIGGKLTQSQAKAVDVVCSAVMAPCLMACLNYIWFASARVSAVNEKHPVNQAGVPLTTLVAVSNSVGGSYDILNLHTLLQGRTWRLSMLAALIVLSAIAKSAVSNVIAYEVYTVEAFHQNTGSLRYLADRLFNPLRLSPYYQDIEIEGFGVKQQSDIANQITGLLTGLSYEQAASNLVDGAYVGVNSTTNTMNDLPSSVVSLSNVPGYRLTVDCTSDQPDRIAVTAMGGYTTVIEAIWDIKVAEGWTADMLSSNYPGLPADIQGGDNDYYQFAAFSLNNTYAYLGYLTSFNLSSGTIESSFGKIKPVAQNMTTDGFSETKSVMSYWGIRCSLNRQEGLLNFTRTEDQNWAIAESIFSNKSEIVPSFLAQWQTNLNYHAPRSTIPGIGPALAMSAGQTLCSSDAKGTMKCDNGTDFETLAQNYLYASGEAQRMLYEVASTNTTLNNSALFYQVEGTITEQYYRITYVPAILVVGLITLFAAAATTAGLAMYSARTYSARSFRKVDTLRLVVDAIDGFDKGGNDMAEVASLSGSELDKWAKGCLVQYEKVVESGEVRIRLTGMNDVVGVESYDMTGMR